MAYCTADEVNILLGSSLSAEAEDAALGVIEQVSSLIDRYMGESWVGGTITNEVQTVTGGQITLSQPPVTAISSISVTAAYIGAPSTVLVAGQTYQLLDPSRGLVLVSAGDAARATVTYTFVPEAVPGYINLAAQILSAHCIRYAIDPTGWTLSKLESGTARLTYVGGDGGGSGAGPGAGLPALFKELLGGGAANAWVMV